MFIPIVLGTAREGRRSENVANKVAELLNENKIETEIFDVRETGLSVTGGAGNQEFLQRWKSALNKSIGFIVIAPEYNHGYPGELKLFLDQTFKEYENKVVGIISIANGLWGGTRVTEQLRLVLNAFNTIVLGMAIHLRNVGSMIDENGDYLNPELPGYVKIMVDKIVSIGERFIENPVLQIQ